MMAEGAIRVAVLAALRGDAALMALLNGAWDGTPVKASVPYAVVGETLGSDWGTKDAEGREVRIGVTLYDRGETPARLAQALALADAAVRTIDGLVDGWEVAGVAFLRSRLVKGRDLGWTGLLDYRVRMLRV